MFETVADYLVSQAETRFPEQDQQIIVGEPADHLDDTYIYFFSAEFPDPDDIPRHFDLSREIGSGDDIVTMKEMLLHATIESQSVVWTVIGNKKKVGRYVGEVFRLAGADYFSNFRSQRIFQGRKSIEKHKAKTQD